MKGLIRLVIEIPIDTNGSMIPFDIANMMYNVKGALPVCFGGTSPGSFNGIGSGLQVGRVVACTIKEVRDSK